MRSVIRWAVAVVVIVHGLLHLLGAAKGLGGMTMSELSIPIGGPMGAVWLAAAVLTVAAGVLLASRNRRWWVVGAVAVVLSEVVIATSWADARAGTAVNVVLLVAVLYGYASQGPSSYRAEYRRLTDSALAAGMPTGVVTEADLEPLPALVAGYVRKSGAVGRPRVTSFRARIHGRIRGGADKPWMPFTGEQVNTYGAEPSRVFFIDATMFGLPVDVLHSYVGPSATMRVKACSLVPMVNSAGPEMDRAETVTMFNDLCVLAPAALVDAPVRWQEVDGRRVRGVFTNGVQTVTADLLFDDDDLVDFVSDDRMATTPDGKNFTPRRWSTPISDYRSFGTRRVGARGDAHWHAPAPEGEFSYLEFILDDIAYNVGRSETSDSAAVTADDMDVIDVQASGAGRPTVHHAVRGGLPEQSGPVD